MNLAGLNRRIAELESRLLAEAIVLWLPDGRKLTIGRGKEAAGVFLQTVDLVGKVFKLPPDEVERLELSPVMVALLKADPDPEWPPLLHQARHFLRTSGCPARAGEMATFVRSQLEKGKR